MKKIVLLVFIVLTVILINFAITNNSAKATVSKVTDFYFDTLGQIKANLLGNYYYVTIRYYEKLRFKSDKNISGADVKLMIFAPASNPKERKWELLHKDLPTGNNPSWGTTGSDGKVKFVIPMSAFNLGQSSQCGYRIEVRENNIFKAKRHFSSTVEFLKDAKIHSNGDCSDSFNIYKGEGF